MIDSPPNEALEAGLYAIDVKIAEVRALLIELRAISAGSGRIDMPQAALDAYIEVIDATLAEAILAQNLLLAPKSPRSV